MAFVDVVDNYATGATGTLTAPSTGETVGYTVTSGVSTVTFPNTDQGAEIQQDGDPKLVIDFDTPVTGLTLTFDLSNSGETYLVEINGVIVDLNTLLTAVPPLATFTTQDVSTGGAGTHFVTGSGGVSSSGSFNNNSIGFLTLLGEVSSIGVVGEGTGGGFDVIEIGIDDTAFDVLCFAAGTQIATPHGPQPVEVIQPGDTVTLADGQTDTVIAVKSRHIRPGKMLAETRLRPVRISAGALGNGLPYRDLLVSRQHRILIASRIAQRMFGQSDVLVPAIKLVGLPGIEVALDVPQVHYHHLVLGQHRIILAEGAPAETLYLGPRAKAHLQQGDIDVVDGTPIRHTKPACPLIDGKDAKKLVAAHIRHARPLLEAWEPEPAKRLLATVGADV